MKIKLDENLPARLVGVLVRHGVPKGPGSNSFPLRDADRKVASAHDGLVVGRYWVDDGRILNAGEGLAGQGRTLCLGQTASGNPQGRAQGFVDGGQGQSLAQGQFQIGGVVG